MRTATTIARDRVDTATSTTFRGRRNLTTLFGHTASAWKEGRMPFDIGQRVVCVDVNFSHEPLWRSCVNAFPRRNSIYRIRAIRKVHELVGLCFHEIVNASADFAEGHVEAAFDSRRFRPVRSTNVEIFKALLITDRVPSRRQRELI